MAKQQSTGGITSITFWRTFATHRLVFLGIAVLFAVSMIAYFGGGQGGRGGNGQGAAGDDSRVLATVNGMPITRTAYDQAEKSLRGQGGMGGGESQIAMRVGQTLQQQVQLAIVASAAKSRHIEVTDKQVDARIEKMRQGATDKSLQTDEGFHKALESQGLTEDEFRDEIRRSMLAEALENSFVHAQDGLTENDLKQSFEQAKVRHILIAVDTAPTPIPGALPDGQAQERARKVLEELKGGASFAEMAKKYSNDPGSKVKGGDLGWGARYGSGWVKAFADAVFQLKPGQISDPVKSEFGYHIIQVQQFRTQMPKDYEKNKAELLKQLKQERANQDMSEAIQPLIKSAKIVWNDKGAEWRYLYAQAMTQGPSQMEGLIQKMRDYTKGSPTDSTAAAVFAQLLSLKLMTAAPAERDALNKELITSMEHALTGSEDPGLRMQLISLYMQTKQTAKATEALERAHKIYQSDTTAQSTQIHQFLAGALKQVGLQELAAKEGQAYLAAKAEQDKEQAATKKAQEEAAKQQAEQAKKAAAAAKDQKAPVAGTPGAAK